MVHVLEMGTEEIIETAVFAQAILTGLAARVNLPDDKIFFAILIVL